MVSRSFTRCWLFCVQFTPIGVKCIRTPPSTNFNLILRFGNYNQMFCTILPPLGARSAIIITQFSSVNKCIPEMSQCSPLAIASERILDDALGCSLHSECFKLNEQLVRTKSRCPNTHAQSHGIRAMSPAHNWRTRFHSNLQFISDANRQSVIIFLVCGSLQWPSGQKMI